MGYTYFPYKPWLCPVDVVDECSNASVAALLNGFDCDRLALTDSGDADSEDTLRADHGDNCSNESFRCRVGAVTRMGEGSFTTPPPADDTLSRLGHTSTLDAPPA